MHFLKESQTHVCRHASFKLSAYALILIHIVVMIAGIHILQEIFAIDTLTVLKPYLEHDRKHVL